MEFLGSDLGEVDIRVEAGSTRPKSQAGRQMLISQGLQWGLLNPNDPEQKMKMFEELGMTSLLPGAEADTKVVAEENARFMAWAQQVKKEVDELGDEVDPDAVVASLMATFPLEGNPVIDHHPTHLVHHRRLALSDDFRALPKMLQDLFVQHILQAHYMFMYQEVATGIGPTGVMVGIASQQAQQGNPGQSVPKGGGSNTQGKGPGGGGSAHNGAKGGSGGEASGENINKAMNNPKALDNATVPR